jgi:hypothetical protein
LHAETLMASFIGIAVRAVDLLIVSLIFTALT